MRCAAQHKLRCSTALLVAQAPQAQHACCFKLASMRCDSLGLSLVVHANHMQHLPCTQTACGDRVSLPAAALTAAP